MTKLRTFATLALAVAVVLMLWGSFGSLRSFARPNYADLALLSNVLHLVDQHYVNDVDDRMLIEGALKGMLDVLDPHTTYLSPDFYREVQLDTKGEFEGLGIEITKGESGYVTVVSPIDGTPAMRAGIRARDEIVAVCPELTDESCLSTKDMGLLEAVKHMRGPRGSQILIQVMREGLQTPKPYVIVREAIKVPSVTVRKLDSGITYARVSQFQERTAEDLRDALEEGGEIQGLVLDLRDNPGGLLDQAVKMADLFLDNGLIVFSEGRGGANRMEWSANSEGTQPAYPMVVLVNGGSASASEIVAGALQDHKRALVLGNKTFGKGSVQTIIPLDDGSGLRLTTALYYLPSGRSIQEVRIQPDVNIDPFTEAELTALEEERPGHSFGEEDLQGHLTTSRAQTAEEGSELDYKERDRKDRQLRHAVDLLKSWNIFSTLRTPTDA